MFNRNGDLKDQPKREDENPEQRSGSFDLGKSLKQMGDAVGKAQNDMIEQITHANVAQQYVANISPALANQYVRGRDIVQSRIQNGKSSTDFSDLNAAERQAAQTYQRLYSDLPSKIPFYNKENLANNLDRDIAKKATADLRDLLPQRPSRSEKPVEMKEPESSEVRSTQAKTASVKPAHLDSLTQQDKTTRVAMLLPAEKAIAEKENSGSVEQKAASVGARSVATEASSNAPKHSNQTIQSSKLDLPSDSSAPKLKADSIMLPLEIEPVLQSDSATKEPKGSAAPGNALLTALENRASAQISKPEVAQISTGKKTTDHQLESKPWLDVVKIPSVRLIPVSQSQMPNAYHDGVLLLSRNLSDRKATSMINVHFDLPERKPLSSNVSNSQPVAKEQKTIGDSKTMGSSIKVSSSSAAIPSHSGKKEITSNDKTDISSRSKSEVGPEVTPQSKTKSVPKSVSTFELRTETRSDSKAISKNELKPELRLELKVDSKPGKQTVIAEHEKGNSESISANSPKTEAKSGSIKTNPTNRTETKAFAGEHKNKGEAGENCANGLDNPTSESKKSTDRNSVKAVYTFSCQDSDLKYITGAEIALSAIIALAGIAKLRTDQATWQMESIVQTRSAKVVFNLSLPDATQIDGQSQATRDGAVLIRPKVLINLSDSLVSIAEQLFNDGGLSWLILELNPMVNSTILEGKTVVRLRSRQEIFIPVYQDIVEFQSRRTKDMSSRNLITIVEENQIDRELVDQTLSSILGHNSTNLDPLQVLENVIEDEP